MTTQHTPTLSSIVDQLTARIEGIQDTGDPHELAALRRARNEITDHAVRNSRNWLMIRDIIRKVDQGGEAAR